jgi:hypothetical protein
MLIVSVYEGASADFITTEDLLPLMESTRSVRLVTLVCVPLCLDERRTDLTHMFSTISRSD